jgi:antitoxin MazE
MPETTLDLKNWGNSLGVRLPAAIARAANLHVDQRVRVSVEGGRVVIEPVERTAFTLAERLAAYDITRHGGEAMAGPPVGEERW